MDHTPTAKHLRAHADRLRDHAKANAENAARAAAVAVAARDESPGPETGT